MPVKSATFQLHTQGFSDVLDITGEVRDFISSSKISHAVFCFFVPGSTAWITTIEFERGAVADLKKAIERLAPQGIHYDHNARWGDGNGFAHVRAALMGPSISIPVVRGKLQLGTW